MNRLILPFAATMLLGCGGGQKADSNPANPCGSSGNPCADNPCGDNPCGDNPCGGNPCGDTAAAAGAEGGSFAGWSSWTQISPKPFVSKGHRKQTASLHVESAEHADWYRRLPEGTSAPVGFRVVKVMYKDAGATSIANIMGMTKMPAGYDPDKGDWFYGVYDESGTKTMQAGKLEMCIDCHSSSDDTDYLGGMPK
jgi:hypothetical protein